MSTRRRYPVWPLPLLAVGQTWMASNLALTLWSTAGSSGLLALTLVVVAMASTAALLALAVRNCVRIWRVAPSTARWRLLVTLCLSTVFCVVGIIVPVGNGPAARPVAMSVWGPPATFFFLAIVREVRRHAAARLFTTS